MPYALTVKKTEGGKPGQVYYPLQLNEVPKPTSGPKQVLVKLAAAALNHRDLFIRQHLYPGISFTNPLLADGYGTVTALGPDPSPLAQSLLNKPVLLTPCRGWESDPAGPEDLGKRFSICGAAVGTEVGTAQEWVVVDEDEVVPAPPHLTAAEGAALPLVGLTGWRALVTKSADAAQPGRNVLVTGIGGGVALQVLQFAVALGCNVFVTSGDDQKIERAVALGAKGGVNYKGEWADKLKGMLPKERPFLDAVVDGAGGDIVAKTVKLLKPGGVITSYGMTVGPKMDWLIQAALKQVELKGSTMGSKAEFRAMVDFVREHKIRPVVSRVVKGLDNLEGIESLFEDMKAGRQFGKLVILIDAEADSSPKL